MVFVSRKSGSAAAGSVATAASVAAPAVAAPAVAAPAAVAAVTVWALLIFMASCSSRPEEVTRIYTGRRQAEALMLQGHGHSDLLRFRPAEKSYLAALDIYGAIDDQWGTVEAFLALGRVALRTGNQVRAEEFYSYAYSMALAAGWNNLLRDVLNHRADLALRQGKTEEALQLLEMPLEKQRRFPVSPRVESARLRLRGVAYDRKGERKSGKGFLLKAVELAAESGEVNEEAQACYKLASIFSLSADYKEALMWALRALEADKRAEYSPGIAADLQALALISRKSGENAAAQDYYLRSFLAWRGLERQEDAGKVLRQLEELTGRSFELFDSAVEPVR